jgi:hypothetical protein
LLSSLEGASITSVRIAGVQHEFSSLPGVVEDVTDIVLNLKKVKFLHHDKDPRILTIKVEKEGVVTAGDIQGDHIYDVVNKDQLICTLDRKVKFDCEFEVRVGRGFSTGDENKRKDQPIGAKVTLRGRNMYEFLESLIKMSLPKIRDFRGISPKAFDGQGNYTLGVADQSIFPEIELDKIKRNVGFDVTIVTTARTDEEAKSLLGELEVKKQARASLQSRAVGDPAAAAKFSAAEEDLNKATRQVAEAKEEYEMVTQRVLTEMDRFKREKLVDFKSIILDYVQLQIEYNQQVEQSWREVLPSLQALSSQQQDQRVKEQTSSAPAVQEQHSSPPPPLPKQQEQAGTAPPPADAAAAGLGAGAHHDAAVAAAAAAYSSPMDAASSTDGNDSANDDEDAFV